MSFESVQEMFCKSADQFGEHVAVEQFEKVTTYNQIESESNRLANFLLAHRITRDTTVAIMTLDTKAVTIGMISALKAGCVYAYIDPKLPTKRIAELIAEVRPKWFLADELFADHLLGLRGVGELPNILIVSRDDCADWDRAAGLEVNDEYATYSDSTRNVRDTDPNAASYVYFTSGSTGRPKAILGRLSGIDHFVRWEIDTLGLREGTRVSQLTSPSFDAFLRDIFVPLCSGGTICVPKSTEYSMGSSKLVEWLDQRQVNLLHCVPSLLRVVLAYNLSEENFSSLKHVLLAGETLLPADIQRWAKIFGSRIELINLYGSSETTMTKFFYRVRTNDQDRPRIPIGKPIRGSSALVVDSGFRPCASGQVGQIIIRTPFRTHGYLNRPGLTQEKFIPNPFGDDPEDIVYLTGDLGRVLGDGNFEFLGREDRQVKIRGVRVELDEVENVLRRHESIVDVAVTAHSGDDGICYLCAYVVDEDESVDPREDLRDFLADYLPQYMIPSQIIAMDELPRTANRKIDLRSLPSPKKIARGTEVEQSGHQAKELLGYIWSELLGVDRLGTRDSFFDLGGHSLLATQLLSRVRQTLGVDLTLMELFENPTIDEMASSIEDRVQSGSRRQPEVITPGHGSGEYPLSYAQERLFFLYQLEGVSPAYNVFRAFRLNGILRIPALVEAFHEFIRRHDTQRSVFHQRSGEPVQEVIPMCSFNVPIVDLSDLELDRREIELQRRLLMEARTSFDLSGGPLQRFGLTRLAPDEHVLSFTVHHIVSDGWSISILFREVTALYEAFSSGRPSPLAELPIQYADFVYWQREWLEAGELGRQLAFWTERLSGGNFLLELPVDRPRPPVKTYSGAKVPLKLSESCGSSIRGFCQRYRVTPYMLFLATFQTLLHRYSGERDIIVGSPVAGRNRIETEDLFGFFVNSLVMRSDCSGCLSFLSLLHQVRESTLASFARQDVPFERVVQELKLERNLAHTPVFQVAFAFQEDMIPAIELAGVKWTPVEIDNGLSKLDLTLALRRKSGSVDGLIEYSTDLFDETTVLRVRNHFCRFLEHAIESPDLGLSDIPFMELSERHQILVEWSDSQVAFKGESNICRLIDERMVSHADSVAVSDGERQITYRELRRSSKELARRLRNLGITTGDCVGLYLERNVESICGVLGALQAEAAFLPIDPSYPEERLHFMLADSQAKAVLTQEKLADSLPSRVSCSILVLDAEGAQPADILAESELAGDPPPDSAAYMIYTSGSTGQPKAVMIPHRALLNHMLWMQEVYPLTSAECVLMKASISFDVSIWELFLPLLVSARIALADADEAKDPALLTERVLKDRVSVLQCVPSFLQHLVEAEHFGECKSLQRIFAGGELLRPELEKRCLERLSASLVNAYGPSETTIGVSHWRCTPSAGETHVPIGRPVANSRLLICDRFLQPVPVGVSGELLVSGVQLASGYWGRAGLTAEKFIPDPFSRSSGTRQYRTGDLARLCVDGTIEFRGRVDRQVKVRGFRIELKEVEAVLEEHPGVRAAAVVVHDVLPGHQLVAYIVDDEKAPLSAKALSDFARGLLPSYSVPAHIVTLASLPQLPNGKVDQQALRRIPVREKKRSPLGGDLAVVESPVQALLMDLWSELLGAAEIGVEDSFFELGGHSLLATGLISRIRELFKVEIPVRRVFETPTIAELATEIEFSLRGQDRRFSSIPLVPLQDSKGLQRSGPLSHAQERIWFLDQLDPGNPSYIIVRALRLSGVLDFSALERAFYEFILRHESQRTSFLSVGGSPVQVVAPGTDFNISQIDLERLLPHLQKIEAERCIQRCARLPFDLERGPVLRVSLLRLGRSEHVLLVSVHHIACDGWSMRLLIQEITALYEAFYQRQPSPFERLELQYLDFSAWQRNWLTGELLDKELFYWREKLGGISSTTLDLPTDRPRPQVQTYCGAAMSFSISPRLIRSLRALARKERSTLYMVMLAAFQTLLSRYSGQDHILVSSPTAGRNQIELENLVGFFANSLVLSADLSAHPSFLELLEQIRESSLEAYAHQNLPFEMLVQELQPERDLSRSPLFQVVLIYDETETPSFDLPDLRWTPLRVETGTSKFDLTFSLGGEGEGLHGSVEYNVNLFDGSTIGRMSKNFLGLLEGITADPSHRISALPLMTASERHQLAVEWNDTRVDFPPASSIHGLFERRAACQGEAVALIHKEERITYGELDRRADRLAGYLRSLGVGPEVRVGLCVGRGVQMVLGALGILKAGGAYVPLDPGYPRDRVTFMSGDADMSVVVSQRRFAPLLNGVSTTIVCLDEEGLWAESSEERLPGAAVSGGNLAYVLYTSGSTGRPKGVSLTHGNAVNLIYWAREVFDAEDLEGMVASTSICFDVSVFEMFSPLGWGGAVVIVRDPLECASEPMVAEGRLLCTVPSATAELARQGLPSTLHKFFLGGEAVPNRLVQSLYEEPTVTAVLDGYGPSEDTTYTTSGVVARGWSNAPPIGRPASNKQTHILGRRLEPVALGVVGELCIGGAGQVRGYLKRPRLTAEKFVPDPLAQEPGRRLYRTGDLSRFLQDGRIDFLGRVDHQVKVRGFRIELGEIEETLVRHQAIRETVVMAHGNGSNGNQSLVAYVVPHNGSQIPPDELRQHLRKSLPDYMLPSTFVMLDEFPRTPSGKVNRKVLPSPDSERPDLTTEYVAPQSEAEQVIAAVWQEVLERDKVGIYDNFFDLGGHSLLLLRVQEQVQQHFSIDVPITAMFKHSTISSLAVHVSGKHGEKRSFQQGLERAAKKRGVKNRRRQRAKEVRSR